MRRWRLLQRFAVALLLPVAVACASATARPVPTTASAATRSAVHLDVVHSAALGVEKRVSVYLPPSYDRQPARRYPVIIYLHGLFGSETDWLSKGGLDAVADSLAQAGKGEAIIVTPDGDDGWWTNWASDPSYDACADTLRTEDPARYCVRSHRYEDWITRDLVSYVDAHYRTLGDRAHRGIAGLSMGGVGALTLALKHPDLFAATMSHSGVVSVLLDESNPFVPPARYVASPDFVRAPTASWKARLLMALGPSVEGWRSYQPAYLVEQLQQRGAVLPAIRFDCGTEDALLAENRALHWELQRLNVPHEYGEWPGAHSWRYWHDRSPAGLTWMLARLGG